MKIVARIGNPSNERRIPDQACFKQRDVEIRVNVFSRRDSEAKSTAKTREVGRIKIPLVKGKGHVNSTASVPKRSRNDPETIPLSRLRPTARKSIAVPDVAACHVARSLSISPHRLFVTRGNFTRLLVFTGETMLPSPRQ